MEVTSTSPHVCRSTLAAEATSLDAGVDHATYIAFFFSEVIDADFRATHEQQPLIKIMPTTDCRSLYDAIRRTTAQFAEKRARIDVAAIREAARDTRWVPTDAMIADGLTERNAALRNALGQFHVPQGGTGLRAAGGRGERERQAMTPPLLLLT